MREIVRADRVVRRAALVGVCWVLGYSVLSWLTADSVAGALVVSNVLYNVPVVAAAVAALTAAYRRRGGTRTGRAWAMFALSAVLWLIGELIWSGYAYLVGGDPPYPSTADGFYLVGYLVVIPGFLVGLGQGHRSVRARVGIDLALVGLGIGGLAWYLLVAPHLGTDDGLGRLVTTLYPLSDLTMVVCLLTLGLSGHRRLPASVRLAGWSYLVAAVTDVCYMQGTSTGSAYSGWFNDAYQLNNVLLALAGLIAARYVEPDALRLPVGRDLTVVPLAVAATAAAALVGREYLHAGGAAGPLLIGLLVVAGLMWRQYLVTRDRTRLARQLAAALAEQERLAVTDPLTGLHNRRFFDGALDTEIFQARRSGRPLSLVALDLDHFKRINDGYGHPAGDVVLVQTAARLRAVTRGGDVIARYGGEEFVWLLPDTDELGAAILAERLRTTLNELPVELACGTLVALTGSLGVASVPGLVAGTELVREADQAMYRAKATGRDRVVLASQVDDREHALTAAPPA